MTMETRNVELRDQLIRAAKNALHDSLDEPMNAMDAVVDAVLAAIPAHDSLMEVERRLFHTDGFTPTEVIRNALLHIDAYKNRRAHPPKPGSKTAAQILRERRAAGLSAADIPKDYSLGAGKPAPEALARGIAQEAHPENDPQAYLLDHAWWDAAADRILATWPRSEPEPREVTTVDGTWIFIDRTGE